jgi:ketosteroid isomerase-like protein
MPDAARGTDAAALVEGVYRAVAAGGPAVMLDRYDEFFAEDFVWEPALVGGVDGRTYRGRDGLATYWDDFTEALGEPRLGEPEVEEIRPDRVLLASTIHVRSAGGGVPIDQDAAYVFDVRDGRIVYGRTFFSRAEAEEFARA